MHEKKRRKWALFFIGPQLIGLLFFSVLPLLMAFGLSFVEWSGFGNPTFVGLDNYRNLLVNANFKIALRNTAYYSILVIPAGLILALLAALALNNIRGKNIYRVFYFAPVVTSSVTVGVIWMWLLNGDFGLINQLLAYVGIDGPQWLINRQLVIPSIAILGVWWGLGTNLVIFLAGLQGIPRSFYEAAEIDGASTFQKFRNITLPMLSSTTFFVLIMLVIGSFQVFDQAFVMTRGGPARASYTMVYHIFSSAFERFEFGAASAAAVVLFFIILAFTIIQFVFQNKWVYYED